MLGKKRTETVFFKTRFGIHTFGLKFPIDVVILDKNNRVVVVKENLQPWRVFVWNPRFNRVLEMPTGEIRKNKLEIGIIVDLNEINEK
jgi:hypothetical protein